MEQNARAEASNPTVSLNVPRIRRANCAGTGAAARLPKIPEPYRNG
jgi:hypothetical protein